MYLGAGRRTRLSQVRDIFLNAAKYLQLLLLYVPVLRMVWGIMFNVRRFTSNESPLSSLLRPPLALVSVGPNVARSATGMNRRSWATPRSGVMPLAASPSDGLGETKRVGFVTSGTAGENEVRQNSCCCGRGIGYLGKLGAGSGCVAALEHRLALYVYSCALRRSQVLKTWHEMACRNLGRLMTNVNFNVKRQHASRYVPNAMRQHFRFGGT